MKAVALVAGVLALAAGAAAGAPGQATAPRAEPKPLRMLDRCVRKSELGRVVRFRAADRTRLIGLVLGRGPRGVVLAHQGGGGAPGNLCAWMAWARELAAGGYRVLLFDHRGFGSSGSARSVNALFRVDLDVVAAVRELRRRGATSVVLGGGSLGGTAVLTAGARIRPPVQGVLAASAAEQFVRLAALPAVRRLTAPVLYVAAEGDFDFAAQARRLHDATASADKRIVVVGGSLHGAPLVRDPSVRGTVEAWLAERSG